MDSPALPGHVKAGYPVAPHDFLPYPRPQPAPRFLPEGPLLLLLSPLLSNTWGASGGQVSGCLEPRRETLPLLPTPKPPVPWGP